MNGHNALGNLPPGFPDCKLHSVEEGGSMEYETPAVEIVGAGSELVQAFVGPRTDGGATALSHLDVGSGLDED
jgi:hypothetical protein